MRKFIIGVAALLALLVATALIAPNLIDWNTYKGDIVAQAKAATGRDLTIDGDIDFLVLPSLQLTATNIRFANVRGGSAPDMVRLKSLDIQVRLLPLLQGRIEADAITLIEPVILLERLADGRVNWDLAAAKKNAAATVSAPSQAVGEHSGGLLQGVQLDNVRIRRGTVIYRDAVVGTEERIAGLSVQVGVRSLSGPFRIKGDVILRGVPVSFDAGVGALKPTDPAPINLQVTVPSAGTRLELSGGAVITGDAPRFNGKLTINGNDMRRLTAAISGRTRNNLPTALAQPFLLKARLKGTDKGGTVENIDVELGGARASGAVSFATGKRFRAAVRLRLNRIDLDQWVKTTATASGAGDRSKSTPTKAAIVASPDANTAFALPAMDATLDARIDAVTYNRQNLRNIAVKMSLAGGVLRLDHASVLLPGGGEATVSGQLSAQAGKPAYRAKLDGQADNLRAVLGWLGTDVRLFPASRLRKFAFSAAVSGNDEQVHVLDTKISVDTTRIDGGVTIALRDRLAFGATVNIDNLDLDAYAPRPAPQKQPAAPASGDPPKSGATPSNNASGSSKPVAPLAVLNDFDANIRFSVGRLKTQQVPIRDLRFEGTLVGGVLTIRDASVRDVGGARAALSGTLSNFNGIPIFKGTISADAKNAAGLLKLAGVAPTVATRSLGALRLRGKADATADRVKLDLSLAAAGATIKLAGTGSGFKKTPRFDAILTADHKNLAQLMRTFGGDVSARDLGRVTLSAKLKGGLKRLSTSLRVTAAGAVIKSTGTVTNLVAAPVYDLVVTASHPSVGDLARKFAPKYRPAGGRIGPLAINATVKGTQAHFTLSALTAFAGKVNLRGTGRLATSGVRPVLTAKMTAGEIDLNPFLQKTFVKSSRPQSSSPGTRTRARSGQIDRMQRRRQSGAAPKPARGASAERFSSDPFDLSGLGLMDATLSVGASALIYRQFRVDGPVIEGNLIDSKLTIKKFTGKMFDGTFKLAGNFNGRRTPSLDGTVTVAKANVGKALFQAEQFDIQGGITDLSLKVASVGKSPSAMIRSLNGVGSIYSRNGIVKGFDLKSVSDRLKNLDKAINFLSLFGSTMAGGQTRFSALTGSFGIKNGVVRNDDLHLVAEGGEARAAGTADLPRWHMDFNGQFHLTAHPKAPPFTMRAVGPIDNPRRLFKFDKLQAYLLQRGIGSLLRKAFPRSRRQSAPPQQQQQRQQPRKPRLEDLIPGLLKGLGR